MRRILKRLINGILRPVGLEMRQTQGQNPHDPFRVQRQLVKNEQATIFDVGANVGDISVVYRQLFPASTIHAFEPFPPSFQMLDTQFARDPSVRRNAMAVSDREGTIEMNLNAVSDTNSILKTSPQGAETWGENLLDTHAVVQVPTTTIDAYCRAHGIDSIDILKLDIQGAELQALRGARSMLEQQRIALVYMELILAPTYQGQHGFEDYFRYFDEVGYTLLDMFNPVRKGFQLLQTDIIWLPRKK